MTRPFVLAQLSDFHVGADWLGVDPVPRVMAAVDALAAVEPRPDALLVSGDLAENAADAEYELARELIAPLELRPHVLPGNHDDRAALRRHFDIPGTGDEPVQYSAGLGPLRLVVADSTRPGEDPGALGGERLAWLDAELAAAPETPTVLAMHHPPLVTGVPACDEVGLAAADRRALGALLAGHRQVRRIVAGHVHRTISGDLAGCPVLTVPSTYLQTRLALGSPLGELADEPACFALHALMDGELVSHIQPVA